MILNRSTELHEKERLLHDNKRDSLTEETCTHCKLISKREERHHQCIMLIWKVIASHHRPMSVCYIPYILMRVLVNHINEQYHHNHSITEVSSKLWLLVPDVWGDLFPLRYN